MELSIQQKAVIDNYIDFHKSSVKEHVALSTNSDSELRSWFLNAVEADNYIIEDGEVKLEISGHVSCSGNPILFDFDADIFEYFIDDESPE